MAILKDIIKEKLIKNGKDLKNVSEKEIAYQIALYAHRNQYRVDGTKYFSHPLSMAKTYLDIFYESSESPYTSEAMKDNGLPHFGVMEVIFLHDVVEDTEYTLKDIKEVYEEFDCGWFYNEFISRPLKLITHNKEESNETYMDKLLDDPIASLVKMFDSMDNLNVFSLTKFGDYEYERAKRYLNNIKRINDRYHYIEKINNYREDIGLKEKRT
ncbi:MAG: hypothetical protein J5511_00795 [Bacilli bacterium]|nr:hypothetical protein [Bacilli bacterium]